MAALPLGAPRGRALCAIRIDGLRTYTGMLVQGKEKRAVEVTHEPLIDSTTFDSIQKAFQARAYNVVPQGQSADNILKGKVICGCCGGKM